jgi:hypothetical protein
LAPWPVVIPEALSLRFSARVSRLRREYPKLLTLVRASALLHQHQRARVRVDVPGGEAVEAIEATAADAAVAVGIAGPLCGRSLDDLPPQTRRLWDSVRGFAEETAKTQGQPVDRVRLDRRGLQGATGWTYDQLRVHLDRLVTLEYLTAWAKPGQVTTYQVVAGIGDDAPVAPTEAPTEAAADRAETTVKHGADGGSLVTATASVTVSPDPGTTATLGTPGAAWGRGGGAGCPGLDADEMQANRADSGTLGGSGAISGVGGSAVVRGVAIDGRAARRAEVA